MKGINCIRLFSIFYFAVLAKADIPKFEISEERTLDEAPSVVVTFPDGYTDTILLSRHYANDEDRLARNDDCNFIGHLTNEPETCVAMTGCLGSDDIDFTIMSSHASGSTMFHWSKEGDVKLIEPEIEHHMYKPDNLTRTMDDDEVMHPGIGEATQHFCDIKNNCEDLPATQLLKVKVVYDNTFKSGVKNIEKYIKALWTHLQAHYCHSSLTSKVKVEKFGSSGYVKKNMEDTESPTLEDFAKGNKDYLSGADLVAYLGYQNERKFSGRATVDAVCMSNTHQIFDDWKSSINLIGNVYGAHAIGGGLLAHEIGHNLGMRHDFGKVHGGNGNPDTSKNACNHKGTMSYGGAGAENGQWSTCSVNDFKETYNKRKKAYGKWCLSAPQDNFCGTQTLCNKATFKDGVCDPQNNNFVCGYDGGDCCNKNTGWDKRCKAIGDPLKCKCIEECKDNADWCSENACKVAGNRPNCKRTCKLCTPDLNLAIGLENGGENCWTDCKGKQGKCAYCGFDGYCCRKDWTAGNGCDGSFGGEKEHQCVLKPSSSTTECKDSQPAKWNNNWGNLCEKYVGPWNKCDKIWSYCDNKKCGEFCKKTCNKCTATECKDSQPAKWNNNWGKLCEKYVGPWNKCDKVWSYCDNKKCKEFCKKTCNNC